MGCTEKTPDYQACVKFLEAISPKHKQKQADVVDLTSPTEDDMNDKEIPFVKEKDTTEQEAAKEK